MEESKKDSVEEKIEYLETLKFSTKRVTRKRKDHPIEVKYEENDPKSNLKNVALEEAKPQKFDKNNKKNFPYIFERIKEMRKEKNAPVDMYGCHTNADVNASVDVQNFQLLCSLLVSVQNRDESTAAAMERLKAFGLDVDNVAKTSEEKILEVLGGVNFNKTKAKNIKRAADILIEKYDKKIPADWDELVSFPGVGNKIAIILLNTAYKMNVGIGVDTHVHRVSNRLGLAKSKTPDETRVQLEAFVPKEIWSEVNQWMVGFGQQICVPINPKCHMCLLNDICPEGKRNMRYYKGDVETEVKVTKKKKLTKKGSDIQVKEEEEIVSITVKEEDGNELMSMASTQVTEIPVSYSPQEEVKTKKRVQRRQRTL